MEDNGQEVEDVSLDASVSFCQFEKVPNFMVSQALSCLTPQASNFFIYKYSIHSHFI